MRLRYCENKKIVFLADFYKDNLLGGAESNDDILIRYLTKKHQVEKIVCAAFSEKLLKKKNVFLISNFVSLSSYAKEWLKNEHYIIYEHDHKYLQSRDPSVFRDFLAPSTQIINKSFYENAQAVVVLSNICKEVIEKNLHIDNVYNIGCSLWSNEKLDFIKTLTNQEKNEKFAIIDSTNPIKNTCLAVEYCSQKNIDYELIPACSEKDLLTQLAAYEGLVFFPGVLETFSRLSAEAKMLNCKLLTKPKLLGFASEEIYILQGITLIEEMRKRKDNALELFSNLIIKEIK